MERFLSKTEWEERGLNGLQKLALRLRRYFADIFLSIGRFGKTFKQSGILDKIALVCQIPLMGMGYILIGKVEKGLLALASWILFIWYLVAYGASHLSGAANLSFFNFQVISILLIVFVVYLYCTLLSKTVKEIEAKNRGEEIQKSIVYAALCSLVDSTKKCSSTYRDTFARSNGALRVSMVIPFFILGVAQFIQKQFVKGALLLVLQAAFITYMVLGGATSFVGLFTLRVENVRSDYALVYGLLALFIILAFLYLYLHSIALSVNNAGVLCNGGKIKNAKEEFNGLLGKEFYKILLALPILGVLAFTILPLAFMICIAFTDYATSGTIPIINEKWLSWTGLDSFVRLFSESYNFKAFVNVMDWTIVWAVLATFSCYFGGLFLALLINKKEVKAKWLYRSLLVVTMAVPQFVSLRVMNVMFDKWGPTNTLLMNWGILDERIAFWDNVNIAKTLILLINMWVGIPYFMLLLSGLLTNIPKEWYEFADIEGASRWYKFRKITFPHLMYMTAPLLITNFVSNINNFNVIWLLTGGGPDGQGTGGVAGGTDILITWLFKLTMQSNPDYNLGAAIGIIMFIISATLSLIIYRRSLAYKSEDEFRT